MSAQATRTEQAAPKSTRITACRSCGGKHLTVVLDLGLQPIANALLEADQLGKPEPVFPLEVMFCNDCSVLQVSETIPPEVLFSVEYPYYSSFMPSLLAHSRDHAMALIKQRKLTPKDLVVEVASNDGYLLRNFVEAGIPVLGIDPSDGPVKAALEVGVPTMKAFFGAELARKQPAEAKRATEINANTVAAHGTNINDFIEGFSILLADDGIASFEVGYIRDVTENCAFDTVYHEHVFYHSLAGLEPLYARHGLYLNDAERLTTQGGSIRSVVSKKPGKTERLLQLQKEERELGLDRIDYYKSFGTRVANLRTELQALMADLVARKASIAAYGAAAKAATLLNYVNLPKGTISYVVDRNTHKVGKYLPGVQVPIKDVSELMTSRPDYTLVLSWNFMDEIVSQQRAYLDAGGVFLRPVPRVEVVKA
jgi:hypothetical protein